MDGTRILWLLFVIFVHSCCSTQRTLRSWLNRGCDQACIDRNLTTVYTRADGPNDTIHYLWDFSGNPSVLLAVTSSSAWLNISWEDFIMRKQHSVTFTEKPLYTFGVMISKIIEFNDLDDTALIDTTNSTNVNVLSPEFFRWQRKTWLPNDDFVGLDMEGNCYNDSAKNISRNGSIKLSLRGFGSFDHSEDAPHMLHTENSTQIDVILDYLETNSSFLNSRFAIEILMVGGGNPDITMSIDPKKSLDDEHTPGVFEIIEVKTPPFKKIDGESKMGAYLQWRPVSYITASRDVTSSTETIQYPPMKVANRTNAIENTMLYCYYGEQVKHLLTQKITVSLGSKGDGFYKKTNYTTWTFIVGYGVPPEEQFSYLVILIVSIGLGLPLLIMFAAGVYICCHKMPKRHSELYINR